MGKGPHPLALDIQLQVRGLRSQHQAGLSGLTLNWEVGLLPQIRGIKSTFLPTLQPLVLGPTITTFLAPFINPLLHPQGCAAGSIELEEITGVWKGCLMGEKCPSPYKPLSPP